MLPKKSISLVALLAAFAAVGFAQDNTSIDRLKAQIQDQQRQIDQLRSTLAKEQQLMERLAGQMAGQATAEQQATSEQQASKVQPSQSGPAAREQPEAAAVAPINALAPAVASDSATAAHTPSSRSDFHRSIWGGIGEIASLAPVIPSGNIAYPADTTPSPGGRAAPDTPLPDSITFAQGKFKIGALLDADWADYYKSGFGPQFLTEINQLGPNNNGYNSFDINRTYLNMYFSPNDNLTFRISPNIYRQFAGVTAVKYGAVTGVPASANENLVFRLKYAYVDFKNLFKNSPTFKEFTITAGQMQNPLVDWEESLWTYRYVALTPWNYLSLSSTQTGIAIHGPIESDGKTYLDLNAGIYTQSSFHAFEQAESKQLMGRATFYPMGSAGSYEGLGITGFFDYARTNATPDTARTIPIYRGVAMVHFATRHNMSNVAFEYDFGRNAFSSNNLFSGSGPLDQFGLGTTQYSGMDAVIKAIQGTDRAKQRGYDVFGHLQLGRTPFQLLGMFENFQPNTEAKENPADFDRIVAGIQYRANKSLRFAFDFQNLIFTHGQFTIPASQLSYFSSSLANSNPNGIANVVPGNIQSFFINMEFSF